ncbi:hypothetical protein SO802_006866 [Lithocarpus litseifolius]|uniref:TTF-type domain-containing protein n=1 Tax=Lithocarpus litseifolius TaxID=425828 RepID=A0AAW2DQ97_9ROSI
MSKRKTIDAFFKKKDVSNSKIRTPVAVETNVDTSMPDEHPSKCSRIQSEEIDHDPRSRKQICEFPINKQDEIRQVYLKEGPYQPKNIDYPYNDDTHRRQFQVSWFESHRGWLECSPSMDAIYCLPSYLFGKKPIGRPRSDAFISIGFNNWKKVNDGMNCPLIHHVGKDPNSPHKIAVKCCKDLKNCFLHIDKLIEKQTSKELDNNQLWLKTSIECARWLAFQACALRGHDESLDSKNRGNFIELIKFTSTFNDKVASVILENAPQNAKYTSPTIQKEILHILASNVQNAIHEEIGDAKFFILVDEAQDESKREKMAIILRFVDKNGFIKEHFFHVVHVRDTTALTLKKEIYVVLSRYNLHIENIQGQGHDGASNMRGEWNGLQALFLKECPYAYYVHCMAHRSQLALVTASREIKVVHQFFDHLTNIINIFVGSSKRNGELQYAQGKQIENMIASNEIKTGRGANQIGTLQRARDTRWGSHFQSICSLIKNFDATCKVINTISEEWANYKQRGDAEGAYQEICLLKRQLQHYKLDVTKHPDFQNMGTTSELCRGLEISGKSKFFHLIDRMIRLLLTLPVSIETTERAFSNMKLLKTRLHNRMEDELLANNMTVYIEKQIAGNFTMKMIMDEFYSVKNHRQA